MHRAAWCEGEELTSHNEDDDFNKVGDTDGGSVFGDPGPLLMTHDTDSARDLLRERDVPGSTN
jgi:hypothetical protein